MAAVSVKNWSVRGTTFALWALAAASAGYWGLKLAGHAAPAGGAPLASRSAVPPDPAAIARLLGANPGVPVAAAAAPSLASRFALVGVAAHTSGGGAALISVDGKPAKPYRVGSQVEEGLVLQAVKGRQAVLAGSLNGPAVLTLELPQRSAANQSPVPAVPALPPAGIPPGMAPGMAPPTMRTAP
jgi:general secretion pathway protein C